MAAKKKEPGRRESGAESAATAAEGGRVSPEASGISPDLHLLGPEEIRNLFAKAAESDDYKSRWMRAQADLENFRRREAQERRRAADEEADRVLEPVLDAFDTFSRAVEASEKSKDSAALVEGVHLALRELERRLAEVGVTRIEGVGQALNPAMHRAVAQEPTDAHPPSTVLQVFAHGWRRGERVIRPAQVRVAAPPGNG